MWDWVKTPCLFLALFISIVTVASADAPYTIDGISLNAKLETESATFQKYSCEPSTFFPSHIWCQKKEKKKNATGPFTASDSLLQSSDGNVRYISRGIYPAYFASGEIQSEIDRLTQGFGEKPELFKMRNTPGYRGGIIAKWGELTLEPLSDIERSRLAEDDNTTGTFLIDFIDNWKKSIELGLPIYKIGGGAGYLWSSSISDDGKGSLNFRAADMNSVRGQNGSQKELQLSKSSDDAFGNLLSTDDEEVSVSKPKLSDSEESIKSNSEEPHDAQSNSTQSSSRTKQVYDRIVGDREVLDGRLVPTEKPPVTDLVDAESESDGNIPLPLPPSPEKQEGIFLENESKSIQETTEAAEQHKNELKIRQEKFEAELKKKNEDAAQTSTVVTCENLERDIRSKLGDIAFENFAVKMHSSQGKLAKCYISYSNISGAMGKIRELKYALLKRLEFDSGDEKADACYRDVLVFDSQITTLFEAGNNYQSWYNVIYDTQDNKIYRRLISQSEYRVPLRLLEEGEELENCGLHKGKQCVLVNIQDPYEVVMQVVEIDEAIKWMFDRLENKYWQNALSELSSCVELSTQ